MNKRFCGLLILITTLFLLSNIKTIDYSLPRIEVYFPNMTNKIIKCVSLDQFISNLAKNFKMWVESFKYYLLEMKSFRLAINKIFSKIKSNTLSNGFIAFLDESSELKSIEKSNFFSFCFTNNTKINYYIKLKYDIIIKI